MKKSFQAFLGCAFLLLTSASAFGVTLFTFTTTPAGRIVTPGETNSFSYTLTNLDPTRYLMVDSVDQLLDVAGQLTWDQTPFLLPIVAPSGSDTGIFTNFTINPAIPAGSGPFTGNFVAHLQWFNGDPINGGSPVGSIEDGSSAYSITLFTEQPGGPEPGPAPIPEPSTFALVCVGCLAGIFLVRRNRA
jgi:hypothetical protein